MIIGSNTVFRDPYTGDIFPVQDCPKNWTELKEGMMYAVDDVIYQYYGTVRSPHQLKKLPPCIVVLNGEIVVNKYQSEEDLERYNILYVTDRDQMEKDESFNEQNVLTILTNYKKTFDEGDNLAAKVHKKTKFEGQYYMPPLEEADYPLDRITKLMIRSMKIVSSEKRNEMHKEYSFDNLVSTLGGGTEHMSIVKFLEWVRLLGWQWEFSVYNLNDEVTYPLPGPITIRNLEDGWEEIPEDPYKEIFKVPLIRDGKEPYDPENPYRWEDPFKRLIKLALHKKNVPTAVYRKRGNTPHLINNMKSALKSKQKMTSRYFIIWCEILDMGYSLKITNQEGTWYKSVGYEVTTNYVEEEKDE